MTRNTLELEFTPRRRQGYGGARDDNNSKRHMHEKHMADVNNNNKDEDKKTPVLPPEFKAWSHLTLQILSEAPVGKFLDLLINKHLWIYTAEPKPMVYTCPALTLESKYLISER